MGEVIFRAHQIFGGVCQAIPYHRLGVEWCSKWGCDGEGCDECHSVMEEVCGVIWRCIK